MKRLKYISLVLLFLNSCTSFSPVAPVVEDVPVLIDGKPVVSKDPTINFNNDLFVQGIKLNSDENKEVFNLKTIKPSGRWAISENSTAKTNLENNFDSYKNTFKPVPKDDTEYMTNAIKFANSNNYYAKYYFDTEYYKQKKKVLLVKWDPQTNEFLIIHIDGRVSNYQITNKISSPRYIVVPEII
ncbi:MAG: hypothetical protein U0354_04650 [Candidatus Sericytochromatia bacterium]